MAPLENPVAPLGREEYVEQAHFFGALAERLRDNVPVQEVLTSVREELLATTNLPKAIEYLLAELRHAGVMGTAMGKLSHYFTPLQAYLVSAGEDERGRFDMRIGMEVLKRDAEYRAGSPTGSGPTPTRQGLFLFQFEAICRNRLSYDHGLGAMSADPSFDQPWRDWIETLRRKVGMVDLADLLYVHSEYYRRRGQEPHRTEADTPDETITPSVILFGEREGRIALANRRKDPMLLFSSLQRQLGYPAAPKPEPAKDSGDTLPQVARRIEQLEKRIKLLEEEQRGGIDLSQFYGPAGE